MIDPRYLTKSRFKIGLECPTKLYYTKKNEYPDKKIDDSFLVALAKGGFQVGELAKLYFPGGINVDSLDYESSLEHTARLLEQESVIIYEAAFCFGNLFVRTDILVKNGMTIELYEVKAKSVDFVDENLTVKSGMPSAEWRPYLCDIAFQKHVVESALPDYSVTAFLMVADKSVSATVDGLNQKFLLGRDKSGKTKVDLIGDTSPKALGNQLLCAIPVDRHIDRIYIEEKFDSMTGKSFKGLIDLYATYYQEDELLQGVPGAHCKGCEFIACNEDEEKGMISGFKECWKRVYGFSEEDFLKPSVLDIWNCRSKDKFIGEGRFFQSQITPEDLTSKTKKGTTVVTQGMSSVDRQVMQITKSNDSDASVYMNVDGLADVFATFRYPLHFIDFETTAVAIPFNKGRRPYEQIAFQYSHHIVFEDGTIVHAGQWINAEPGIFPNFIFLRALKSELDNDFGTIFRYAPHENTILNKIYEQLQNSTEPDKNVLMDFIRKITKSTGKSAEVWEGERNMIDLWELVKKYYYAPETNGSNSIKYVLPAILNSSEYLKHKYSQPIYGNKIKSLNFSNECLVKFDKVGKVINPYQLLPLIFENVDMELLDEFLTSEEGEIRDGGAAMIAYAQMQFTQMSELERGLIIKSLLKYCELDTMAMVLIWEEWQQKILNRNN